MRIAYLCLDPGVPVFGHKGCSVHVQEVVRALGALGAEVELFATRVDGAPPRGLERLRVHRLPAPDGGGARRERAALGANRALRTALRRSGAFDLVYERYSLWGHAGMEHAAARAVPGVLEVNAPLIREQAATRGLVHRRLAERVAERAFGAASALLAVSDEVAAYLRGHPATRGRVHVLPNGVDVARFVPGASASPETLTVAFAGSFKPWHGVHELARAFAAAHRACPRLRLLLIGAGPEREAVLRELAAHGALAATHAPGAVSPEQVPALLAGAQIGVAPYPDRPELYFSPLKLFEYMAAGLAVVASATGPVQRVVRDEENGLLCAPGDERALAAALLRLAAAAALRQRLGAAARASAVLRHSWAGVARRILAIARAGATPRALPAEVG